MPCDTEGHRGPHNSSGLARAGGGAGPQASLTQDSEICAWQDSTRGSALTGLECGSECGGDYYLPHWLARGAFQQDCPLTQWALRTSSCASCWERPDPLGGGPALSTCLPDSFQFSWQPESLSRWELLPVGQIPESWREQWQQEPGVSPVWGR